MKKYSYWLLIGAIIFANKSIYAMDPPPEIDKEKIVKNPFIDFFPEENSKTEAPEIRYQLARVSGKSSGGISIEEKGYGADSYVTLSNFRLLKDSYYFKEIIRHRDEQVEGKEDLSRKNIASFIFCMSPEKRYRFPRLNSVRKYENIHYGASVPNAEGLPDIYILI